MADPNQTKLAEVHARIQTQRRIMEGNQALRSATSNPDVIRQAESQIREAQRNISYLEQSLQSLQTRRASGGASISSSGTIPSSINPGVASQASFGSGGISSSQSSGSNVGGRPYPGDSSSSYLNSAPSSPAVAARRYDGRPLPSAPAQEAHGSPDRSYAQYYQGAGRQDPGRNSPYGQLGASAWQPAPVHRAGTSARRQYTNLDLIKYDTPHTTAKISRMLHQLEFKLQIEKQYKMGIDKMAKLYQAEGDRKSKNDAESKRVESASKIVLLQQALKRYKQLHVMEDSGEDEMVAGSAEDRRQNLRKPLSGTLQISVKSARDIDHAPIPRGSRSVRESTVVIKVEDTPRARTHPSRSDRWQEDFEIPVDNANELEVTVYDKIGSAHPVPVGMLWIRISDIVEEQRKKKFGQVGGGPEGGAIANDGWVTADGVQHSGGNAPGSSSGLEIGGFNGSTGNPAGPLNDGVEAWFAVEPAGAIFLRVNFIKQNVRKRPYDARLGRQGAFRKRKQDVSEINGHKFVSRQFYQVLRCALCGEFLLNAAGSQCEDCRYMCHKKCAQKVVTKCISKSNAEAERDEVKINHRIPHRFEPITNLSANWCCHCGYILPLGRKNARKCSECDVTCHTDCAHLVPDFCGMSMEMANQLLTDIETINRVKSSAKTQPSAQTQTQSLPLSQSYPPAPLPHHLHHHQQQQQQNGGQISVTSGKSQAPPQIGSLPYQAGASGGRLTGLEQQTQQMGIRPAIDAYGSMGAPPSQQSYPSRPHPPQISEIPPLSSQQDYRPTGPSIDQRPPAAPVVAPNSDGMTRPPRPLPMPQSQQPGLQGQVDTRPQPGRSPSQPYGFGPQIPSPQKVQQQQQQQIPSAATAQQQHLQNMALVSQQGNAAPQPVRNPPSSKRKIGLNDFNFLAVLGKGNFGKVMLAEEKRTGNLYAIKVLKKEFIIENDEVESTKSEKRVFLAAARERHPFLLGLHSCFQTETRVYFVMEYVSGGDLMLHIQREQFTPRRAKFYAAEVLLALEYFHKQGIIYRDLKLDNILLTLDGHVKVADYGLCKEEMWYGNTTSTFCGTPEFMAPEILLEQRYGRAVDWWAFGILIYEMLLGQAPFRGDDEDEIFDAILEDEPLYPIHMPKDSVSILEKLLTRDPAKRLGSGPDDAEEIKAHPFFRDVNWDDMFHKRVPPPFCPTLKNPSDTSWFDTEFTSEKPTLTPVHSVLSAQDQAEFKSFSWTAPHVI
ncbi:hypothetical protein IE53DRAFT_387399 [Violaceomyces palustris]|uniref:Uncharacterized protein n=1 Tax=Violaceomyces palustris TaxID=1673888 RepID=A0ACD0NWV5_9BASI|nr:hypothetical protein IE53DRAFT_387399 [Violaceomyces palustris]